MKKILTLMLAIFLFTSCSEDQTEVGKQEENAAVQNKTAQQKTFRKTEEMIGFEKHLKEVFRMMEDPNRNEDQIRTDFTKYLKEYLALYGESANGYEGNALLMRAIEVHQAEIKKLNNLK